MGQIANFNLAGYPGAITRSIDNIIEAKKNVDTAAIAFGAPVIHHATQNGVTNWASTATADKLVGFAVRSASKTPETYGSNTASYAAGDLVDVIKRGNVIVPVASGSPKVGGKVHIVKATGEITATASESTTLELTNCKFHSTKDANNLAEITITERQF